MSETTGPETRRPGHYLTIRVDRVAKRYKPNRGFREDDFVLETETLIEAANQTFSTSLLGAFLRALADEIDPHVRAIDPTDI